jgi:hypothetical protein
MKKFSLEGSNGWKKTITAAHNAAAKAEAESHLLHGVGDLSVFQGEDFIGVFRYWHNPPSGGATQYGWEWTKG